jgi:ABC-type glycerol-3-phosphate transport system permease component
MGGNAVLLLCRNRNDPDTFDKKRENNVSGKLRRLFIYFFLCVLAVMVLYPLYFALISSIKPIEQYATDKLGLPKTFYLQNYVTVLFRMNLLTYMMNTVITVSLGMFFYLIVCSAAGLAFGKFNFKGQIALFSLILFFQIFPQMVVAGELYQLLSKMRLLNTRMGIILAWCAYFAPFGSYIMTTYFAAVPREILESARIDGSNVIQILFKIMMPVAKPMLGTIGVIGTLSMWNELPFAGLILQRDGLRTLTVGIALLRGEYGLPIPVLSAAVIISSFIPMVCYLLFQNFIALDVTAGSVKG